MSTAEPVLLRETARAVDSAGLQRILRNWLALLGAYVLPRGLTFGSALIAARVLGPEHFGAYGTAASYAIIVSILCTLGMMPLLVRELARTPERAASLLSAAHIVKAVAAFVMLAVLVGSAAFLLHYPPEIVAAAALLGIGYAFSAFAENLGAYFQAIEHMRVWLESSIWFGVVGGALGIALVLLTHSVVWFCLGFACGQLASLLWLLRRLPAHARGWSSSAPPDARRLMRAALPFAAAFLMLTIFYKFDVLLLGRLQSNHVVGLYAAGYKLVDIVHALAVVAAGAIYPRLSRLHAGHERTQSATRALELFLLGGVVAAGTLWVARAPVTLFLFGPAYDSTSAVLALLAPGLAALTISILAGYLLSAADHLRALALAYVVAVLLKLVLGLWWIPQSGAQGMAAATLVAQFALALLLLGALARYAAGQPRLSALALAGGAGVLAPLCARLLPAHPLSAAVVYVAAVLAWYAAGGALPQAERQALLGALRPRTQST